MRFYSKAECLESTRAFLRTLAATQDALTAELDATGLTDLTERLEWLTAHWTPLDALAYELREAHRAGWRVSGRVRAPIVNRPREFKRPTSLASPKVRKPYRFEAWQIALMDRVLEQQEAS